LTRVCPATSGTRRHAGKKMELVMPDKLETGNPRRVTLTATAARLIVALVALAALAASSAPLPTGVTRSVRQFGVSGTMPEPQTELIQGAIDACALEGGCTLVFPSGYYVTGTLFLRDAVRLHLEPGATIAASRDPNLYPAPALIYGKGLSRIALTGQGYIQAGPVPYPGSSAVDNPGSRLVSVVLLENCASVQIQGLHFQGSPTYTIALRVVDSAWVDTVSIDNAVGAFNNGGLVIDSSSRVNVHGFQFRGGGDGITIQASDVAGVSPPSEQLTISDSTIESGSMALKIGTATAGDIRNVVVSNFVCTRSQGGIGIFVRDGGTVENLQFANTVIETEAIRENVAEWPLVLDLKRRSADSPEGVLRDVHFHNTQIRSGGKILVSGFTGHPVRDLRIDGLDFSAGIPTNDSVQATRPWKSTEDEVRGEDQLPAAIVVGYVTGAVFRDVRVKWPSVGLADEGHALFLHSADGVRLDGWEARQAKTGGELAAIHLMSARGVEIRNSTAPPQTGIWLQLQRMAKQDVFLSGNATSAAYRTMVVTK
jgi:polygalacturonase